MIEQWKEIGGYEGLYKISSFGRIFSLRQGKILKPRLHPRGYVIIDLYKDKVRRTAKVHRLVANAFIENKDEYDQINHIDENKTNNRAENLEWCDSKYNNNYGKHGSRYLKRDALGRFSK